MRLALSLITFGLATALASAAEFDFKDAKGVNSVSFLLDSELEPIRGVAAGITGTVNFDPANPAAATGRIVIAASSVKTPSDEMTNVLHGEDWLNVQQHKEITFDFKKVSSVSTDAAGRPVLNVTGDFTCTGVTKSMDVQVHATYLEGKLAERNRGAKGDLLVLRSTFTINRKDFGIKKEYGPAVVAEEIQISVQIVGAHAK